jgi:hypothetical protein
MMTKKTILQIPVEGQIREFYAKLLLACIATKRGNSSVIQIPATTKKTGVARKKA